MEFLFTTVINVIKRWKVVFESLLNLSAFPPTEEQLGLVNFNFRFLEMSSGGRCHSHFALNFESWFDEAIYFPLNLS